MIGFFQIPIAFLANTHICILYCEHSGVEECASNNKDLSSHLILYLEFPQEILLFSSISQILNFALQ